MITYSDPIELTYDIGDAEGQTYECFWCERIIEQGQEMILQPYRKGESVFADKYHKSCWEDAKELEDLLKNA